MSTRKESLNVQRGEGFDLDSSFKNGKNGKILETISDSSYLKFPDKENDLRSLLEKKFDFMRYLFFCFLDLISTPTLYDSLFVLGDPQI